MNIKTITAFLVICLSLLSLSAYGKSKKDEFRKLYENLPFKMDKVKRPSIPSRTFGS